MEQPIDALLQGDAYTVLSDFPDNSVNLIVTSPPYWNAKDYKTEGQIGHTDYETYLGDLLKVWEESERILVPNGKLCINTPMMPVPKSIINDYHTRYLQNINNDVEHTILTNTALQRFSLYVWEKQTSVKMFGSYPYPPNLYEDNTIEFINVFVKPGRPKKLDKMVKERSKLSMPEWLNLTKQIWCLYPEDVGRKKGHPAPFPLRLAARLISMYTFRKCTEAGFPGDIVLDMFVGTGATCVAAKILERRFVGIDINPKFLEVAEGRLKEANALVGRPPFSLMDDQKKWSKYREEREKQLGLQWKEQ